MRNAPSFGLLSQAPFQGITDKSWTKYTGYPEVYRQVLEMIQWDHEINLPALPYEEAKQLRSDWYTFKSFIIRNKDLHFHFEQKADHIVAKLIQHGSGTLGTVQFLCPIPKRNLGLDRVNNLMNRPGFQLTQSPITQGVEPTPLAPASTFNPGGLAPEYTNLQEQREDFRAPPELEEGEVELGPEHFNYLDDVRTAYRYKEDIRLYWGGDIEGYYNSFNVHSRMPREEFDRILSLDTSELDAELDKQRIAHTVRVFSGEAAQKAEVPARIEAAKQKLQQTLDDLDK